MLHVFVTPDLFSWQYAQFGMENLNMQRQTVTKNSPPVWGASKWIYQEYEDVHGSQARNRYSWTWRSCFCYQSQWKTSNVDEQLTFQNQEYQNKIQTFFISTPPRLGRIRNELCVQVEHLANFDSPEHYRINFRRTLDYSINSLYHMKTYIVAISYVFPRFSSHIGNFLVALLGATRGAKWPKSPGAVQTYQDAQILR